MTTGYWDRDGFHEGVLPAIDFTPRLAPIADSSAQVSNSTQPAHGVPRGGQVLTDLTHRLGNRQS